MTLPPVARRWDGGLCVVAATGPSLTPAVAEACRGQRVVAVNDACRLMPWADVLYACDEAWWNVHKGCPDFAGEKWSSHEERRNDKLAAAEKWGLHLVAGVEKPGFSLDPARIHYGRNSGFQGINLAILFGANPIVLCGFTMSGKDHFFGKHGAGLRNGVEFSRFLNVFDQAAKMLPPEIKILNATKNSALRAFPMVKLEDVL